MKHKFAPLFLIILLSSCRTINYNRTELNIPPSVVYFSFDDGPNARGDTTARLLDVLKKYQIKAMFCLLGENAERYPELVRRMDDEGHCIANHGYSDKWASRMKPDEFRDNLVRGGAAISSALGRELYPKLYRPHGGFYRSAQEKIMREEGYILVPATARVYDAVVDGTKQRKVTEKIIKKVEKQGGGMVLLHDARDSHVLTEAQLAKNPRGVFDRSWIPDAVDAIIPALVDRGFLVNSPDILTAIGNCQKTTNQSIFNTTVSIITEKGVFLDKAVVYEKLKELMISEFKLDADSITPEKQLYDDLQLDSLDMVDLILSLNDYIGEKIDPSLFKDSCTVQDLVDAIDPLWK